MDTAKNHLYDLIIQHRDVSLQCVSYGNDCIYSQLYNLPFLFVGLHYVDPQAYVITFSKHAYL